MPITCCPTCGLTVYSVAGHSTTEECPQCGNDLPPAAGSVRRALGGPGYLSSMGAYLRRTGRAQASWLRLPP